MNTSPNSSRNNPPETDAGRIKEAKKNNFQAISSGILAIVIWLSLLTIGLQVNSSYYRAAISYGYWDWRDWLASIVSFTLSNVALLAFFAGFLGGICSKIIVTEGFMLTRDKLIAKKVAYVLYENPFISAFRGIFLFLAILSLQYISSFSDLSGINKDATEKQPIQAREAKHKYVELLDSLKDSVSRKKVIDVWEKEDNDIRLSDADSNYSLVKKIFLYKDSIDSKSTSPERKDTLQEKIRTLRRSITVPPISDIPGMSSSSYFRFAMIVSLLAFICGYDPRLFSNFLSKLPFINEKDNENNKPTRKKENG